MMLRRATLIGIGAHVGVVAMAFMVIAGNAELHALARVPALAGILAWGLLLLLAMLVAYRAWSGSSRLRRAGLLTLALPGWTLGLPIVLLYLLRSNDGDDLDASFD